MVTAHHRRSGILIADDSELMRMIVREALERETDFEICAEAVVSAYAWILSAIGGLDNQSFPLLLVASASLRFQDGITKRFCRSAWISMSNKLEVFVEPYLTA